MDKKDSITHVSGKIIQIDEAGVRDHLAEIVRGSVENTLNAMLQKEADELCQARRYERDAERLSTRSGSYQRKLETNAPRRAATFGPRSSCVGGQEHA